MERIQLTPEFVQAVRDAVLIEDIASDYTQLKKHGRRHLGLCPFHREKTPSFSVDPEQGLYYCFGCGAGGDAIGLHMQLTGDDFPTALEALASRYGVPIPRAARRTTGRPELDLEPALVAANAYFRSQLAQSAFAQKYLERRRIASELIAVYELGYAPDGWRGLYEALHPRLPLAALEGAGLVSQSERADRPFDRFRHRLMFPIHSPTGGLVGFGGRTLGDDRAKYINTRETGRFQKGHLLYGLHRARRPIRERGRVLVVEGYFDVLAAIAAGVEETVASMGTALTPQQARLLSRYADEVVLGYDGDRAGEEACRKALPLLLAEGLVVKRAAFPAGQDPDSLRLDEGPEAVREVVDGASDAVLREIDRLPADVLHRPDEQARAAAELRPVLQSVKDDALRNSYGRRAAERLGLPVDAVLSPGPHHRTAGPRDEQGASRLAAAGPRPPSSTEERCLKLLLLAADAELDPERLPPAAAFLQPECRAIYGALLEVLAHHGGETDPEPQPDELRARRARAVRERLPPFGPAIDRLAEVLLQEPVQSGHGELAEHLHRLEQRFMKQRRKELAVQIQVAQREGDTARIESLIQEQQELVRQLHPRSGGPSR